MFLFAMVGAIARELIRASQVPQIPESRIWPGYPACSPLTTAFPGLPLPLSESDYQLANAIDYAAWDAGLCEICHKDRFVAEAPAEECQCLGGDRALHRLSRRAEYVLQQQLEDDRMR